MKFFEYPDVIISILAMLFFVMVLIGLYFTIKSVKTAKGTTEKSFCSIGKIENDYDKADVLRENRCVVYISISLANVKRVYSEAKAIGLYENIKEILFNTLCLDTDGAISLYDDENFVSLNGLESYEVIRCIENCYDEINEAFVSLGAVNIVPVRFGYFCTTSTEVPFKTALARAKQAASMAEDRDDLYCQWDSANGKEFERKLKMENTINSEIDNNRFFLEYQPLLDAGDDKIVGAEVLARLNSPTEGILTPRYFLSAVNNVGLNKKFDYYIFEKNCKWISSDKEKREKYVYNINFSRYTLCDPELADTIIGIVEKYGIAYTCIAIEILEDKTVSGDEKFVMTQNLKRLKEKGVLIFLDDFGAGITNFGDLTDFDISIVKIDKSITRNAATPNGFLVLKNIIRTAHDLGFMTLCEGIETEEDKKMVVDAGADMLQGYYFYRPMPVTQLETLLEKQWGEQ